MDLYNTYCYTPKAVDPDNQVLFNFIDFSQYNFYLKKKMNYPGDNRKQ